MKDDFNNESTLRDYLKIVFTYKLIIIIPLILTVITHFIKEEFRVPNYVATVKMKVSGYYEAKEDDLYKRIFFGRGLISDHAEDVKSRVVIERVINSLKLYKRPIDEELKYSSRIRTALMKSGFEKRKNMIEALGSDEKRKYLFNMAVENQRARISTSVVEDTPLFYIYVNDVNPAAAVAIANTLSRSYIIHDLEKQISEIKLKYGEKHISVVQLHKFVNDLYNTLDGKLLSSLEAMGPASVKIVEQAYEASPVGVPTTTRTFIKFFVSFIFGFFLAFIFNMLDQTFRSPQDVDRSLKIPVIYSIPKRKKKAKQFIENFNHLDSRYKRSIHRLSDQLHFLMKNENSKSILISDVGGSGESDIIIANLSTYLASKDGYKVLIIEANLRSPSMSRIFNVTDNPGLMDVIEEKISFEDAVQIVNSNLHVLFANNSLLNPFFSINSFAMSDLINKAKEQYEIVFINCADLVRYTDAILLSSLSDAVAVVINEGKVRRKVAEGGIAALNKEKVNIIGAIFNNSSFAIPEIIYKLT